MEINSEKELMPQHGQVKYKINREYLVLAEIHWNQLDETPIGQTWDNL